MRRTPLALPAILLLIGSLVLSARAATRPELDAASQGTAPGAAARLVRLSRDPALTGIAQASQTDSRYGVPTFLWATRTELPTRGGQGPAARSNLRSAARDQVQRLAAFYGLSAADVRGLVLRHFHDTGRGAVIAAFRQSVDGIEVFRDELRLNLDREGGLISASGFVPPASLGGEPAARVFRLTAAEAARVAVRDLAGPGVAAIEVRSAGPAVAGYERFVLDPGAPLLLSAPIRAKQAFFHLPATLVPGWYVEVLAGDDPYAYVVSAADGALLFRHRLEQSDAYAYRVWADATGDRVPLDGPQGSSFTPHPTGTPDYSAPGFVSPILISLQNGPIATNDPWLPPAATQTQGNNVDAYADVASPDGFSPGDFRATPTSANTFDRPYDTSQNANVSTTQQMAAITQLFYVTNFFHDWYYGAGFDEAAGDAQASNYGRGGIEGDPLLAEAQDNSGTNNANMMTPADGASPRMQMYIWTPAGLAQVSVLSPPSIAGNYVAGAATGFGPQTFSVTANVVLVNDGVGTVTDGCSTILNSVSGSIALIDRGNCTFLAKAQAAQAAGAVGVIIADNVSNATPPAMGGTGSLSIPVLSVTLATGNAIKNALLSGAVSVTLTRAASVTRDGTIDDQIVAHEWGHYISNRLIGNASGLGTNMAGGLGEGWADFHSMLMTVRAGDDYNGTYAAGSYVLQPSVGTSNAYYFGVRRVPYSTQMTKDGLTFRHIQNGVPLPVGPPTAFGSDGSNNAEVHNTGEVWCTMLWECYAALLNDSGRLTFAQAQSRMKDYLVAAYQLTPNDPTLLEARDALLSSAYAGDPADFALFWQAFAKRGAGVGAVAPDRYSTDNIGVVESYSTAGRLALTNAVVSDDVASCDHDGYIDAGESGRATLTFKNVGASTLANTALTVSSGNPAVQFPGGTSFNLASTPAFTSHSVTIPVTVAASASVGLLDLHVSASDPNLYGGPQSFVVDGFVNTNVVPSGSIETVDAGTPNWSFPADSMGSPAVWTRADFGSGDWRFNAVDPGAPAAVSLLTPPLQVGSGGPFRVLFDHAYSFETDGVVAYDGGVIEISHDGGAHWSDAGAYATPAYTEALYVGSDNPLAGRSAYTRTSPGYPSTSTVTLDFGSAYAGQTVQLRFRVAADAAVGAPGWSIRQLQFEQVLNQPFLTLVAQPGTCTPTAVTGDSPRELEFSLAGPQPAVGGAEFRFALPAAGHVSIAIHDVSGRRVATLLDRDMAAGRYSATWDRAAGNAGIPAGVYFARMWTAGRALTRRVVVLR